MLKNKKIIGYVLGTYFVTWLLWLAAFNVNGVFRMIGSFVPSAMGILFIYKKDGRAGFRMLFDRIKKYKVKWYVYFVVILYTILSFLIPYVLTGFFQKQEIFQIRKSITVFDVSNPLIAVLCFFMILVMGGPLGEELGWRGYLLPSLEEQFRPEISGIIVGIVWACWHLPMFLFHVEGYQMSFLLYLIQTIIMSLYCTWLYHVSENSLLMVLLFHTMDNFVCSIAFQNQLHDINLYTVFYWCIQGFLLVYVVRDLRKYKRGNGNLNWKTNITNLEG